MKSLGIDFLRRQTIPKLGLPVLDKVKISIVESTIENLFPIFSISDLERLCPTVSRDMIRIILNRLRKEGSIFSTGTGRGAQWKKRGHPTS